MRQTWFHRRSGEGMFLGGLFLLGLASVLMITEDAAAQSAPAPEKQGTQTANPWLDGEWQLGAVGTWSSDPYKGSNEDDINPWPMISFDSERLHVGLDGISAALWKNEFASVAVIGALRMEPFESGDSPYLSGLYGRDMAWEAGFAGDMRVWRGTLGLRYLTDVNDAHDGHEIDMTYELPMEAGPFQFGLGGGVMWRSDNLNDYYVGVRSSEARGDRPAYAPDGAFIPHVDLTVSYPFTQNIIATVKGGVELLPDTYTDSPIIDDDVIYSAMVGLIYRF
ncbi:MipA/OmpV family protein [Thalassospira sp.]|uniref:MipA/OmpV family protein n=1 Tax=Thalassospira sp. TaxID=1912094 RepID=UPI002736FA3A|nr:MipA/OmpV family protein [Thalassospira sp.]MDP2698381.1 MipA/OmpV family protein [Thalassospira sp.]